MALKDVLVLLAMIIGFVLLANAQSPWGTTNFAMKPSRESSVIFGQSVSGPLLQEPRMGKRNMKYKLSTTFNPKKLKEYNCNRPGIGCIGDLEGCPPDKCFCDPEVDECGPLENACYFKLFECSLGNDDPCLQVVDLECECDEPYDHCKPRTASSA